MHVMYHSRFLARLAFGGVLLFLTGCLCSNRPGLLTRLRNLTCADGDSAPTYCETMEGPIMMAPGMTVSQPIQLEPAPTNLDGMQPLIQEGSGIPPSTQIQPPRMLPRQEPQLEEKSLPADRRPADPSSMQRNLNKTVTQPRTISLQSSPIQPVPVQPAVTQNGPSLAPPQQ